MNRSLIIGCALGAAVATVGGVWAGYTMLQKGEPEVVVATHVAETAREPECSDEPRDKHRIAGTVGAPWSAALSARTSATAISPRGGCGCGRAGRQSHSERDPGNRSGCPEPGSSP